MSFRGFSLRPAYRIYYVPSDQVTVVYSLVVAVALRRLATRPVGQGPAFATGQEPGWAPSKLCG